jgi:hypothetical protein
MFSRRYAVIKKEKLISKKRKYGTFLFRLLEVLKLSTIEKFCIEI